MSRRTLTQLALLVAVLLFSAGLQSLATFTEPNTTPPNADAYAPLTTGPASQGKQGGLVLGGGLDIGGNVGIGTTNPKGTLDVENSNKTATLCLNGSCVKSLGGSGSNSIKYFSSKKLLISKTYSSFTDKTEMFPITLNKAWFGGATPTKLVFAVKMEMQGVMDLRSFHGYMNSDTFNNTVFGISADDTDQGPVSTHYLVNSFIYTTATPYNLSIGFKEVSGWTNNFKIEVYLIGYM